MVLYLISRADGLCTEAGEIAPCTTLDRIVWLVIKPRFDSGILATATRKENIYGNIKLCRFIEI